MPKQIPILFKTEMVKATRSLIKTVTRRTRNLNYINEHPNQWEFIGLWIEADGNLYAGFTCKTTGEKKDIKSPYGKAGDILWGRESYLERGFKGNYAYKADNPIPLDDYEKWKPSIHMPKEASRIWLEVVNIGMERLHDITPEGVTKEGIQYPVVPSETEGLVNPVFKLGVDNSALSFMPDGWEQLDMEKKSDALLLAHFAELWCEINGVESWNSNMWVWVISYKVLSLDVMPDFLDEKEVSHA